MMANILETCWLGKIFDIFWPRRCEMCGKEVERPGRYVCSACVERLPFVPVTGCCRQCGRDAEGLTTEFLCEECRQSHPHFDRVASVMRFTGELREMVNAFKFRNHYWLSADFVDWLEALVKVRFKVGDIDIIVPMPITLRRRLDRGFNQCDYLGRLLARRLGKRYAPRALKRINSPERQGGLSESERRENVIGTFAVRQSDMIRNKTVLVVDDIMTTGSTLSECAAELKRHGAERVWAVTLARTFRT